MSEPLGAFLGGVAPGAAPSAAVASGVFTRTDALALLGALIATAVLGLSGAGGAHGQRFFLSAKVARKERFKPGAGE